jgi:hypothetical protein
VKHGINFRGHIWNRGAVSLAFRNDQLICIETA